MNENIDTIVKSCQSGDRLAFKHLYDLHSSKAYNTAYRILQNADLTKDAVQDSFIKVYKNICSFKFESSFSTWFYRILVNTCLDYLRKKNIQAVFEVERYDEDEYSKDIKEILDKEIAGLPDAYRTVFILYEIEGFSHSEISSILKIAVGTSKSNLNRAKEILKTKLKVLYETVG
jgi:RNA polymerase sigma-70 factor (ECF subfamily)